MASDLGVGDIEVPWLDVAPGDADTVGSFTVEDPDNNVSDPITATTGTPSGGTARLTANEAVTFDQAGRWVLHWTVTGTGAGEEDQEVYVVASPVAGGPAWIPGRSRVANYVPHRTLTRDAETHEYTFSSTTHPPGIVVDRLIADAVAWVGIRVGEVHSTLHDAASVAAALMAACAVERGYPAQAEEQALARARDLCQQAAQAREDLARANESVTGTDPTNPGSALLPLYSFPGAVTWGDLNL